MNETQLILVVGILLVVFFDFTNGFHDAADMIATAIASHSISPARAIALVTFFTFLGPLIGGVAVADTIGQFVQIDPQQTAVAQTVVISGLISAIAYNLVTWKLGLPSSSSASLSSGLVGAGLHSVGYQNINWGIVKLSHFQLSGFMKIITGMVFSPLVGFVIGIFIIKLFLKLFARLTIKVKPFFIIGQYFSISWLAFSHGTNDAQKGMGMIAMMLFASGVTTEFTVPLWVILLCATSITTGTLFGGWNIIKTVGFGIYRIRLVHSIADQIGSAAVILSSSFIGAPVSTTQVVTTTLVGIGTGEHPDHVKWKNVKNIFAGWTLNIPISVVIGYLVSLCLTAFIG
jgi:PiT family inorganic phosphate transporter